MKYFRISIILSLVFHFLILAFLITTHSISPETPRYLKANTLIQVSLIKKNETPKKHILTATKFSEVKSVDISSEKKAVIKQGSLTKNISLKTHFVPPQKTTLQVVKTNEKKPLPVNKESLQNDIRRIAENIAFGNAKIDSVSSRTDEMETASSSATYRRYVDACREKLIRIGSRYGDTLGTAILHLVINKNGNVTERYVESYDSPELITFALQVIDKSSPFIPFPKDLKRDTIAIAIPTHFVIK